MRGLFYSVIAILFIMPLVLLTISNIRFNGSEIEIAAVKVAGGKIASFSKSIDSDMPRALDIMAKRSVTQSVIWVEASGLPLNDSSSALSELITNGTIYGVMTDANFTVNSWTYQLSEKGKEYGFQTDIRLIGTRFHSLDSGHLGAELAISVNISSPSVGMSLFRVFNKTVPVSIEGFDDPLYTLNTNGILKRPVYFYEPDGTTQFDNAVDARYYMASSLGPSFLDRLEGRLANSGKYGGGGMETIVFLPDLQANGITVKAGQSDIDYLYFDSSAHSGSNVQGSSHAWLKIDPVHAAIYNLTLG
jgi:hypothetical protein